MVDIVDIGAQCGEVTLHSRLSATDIFLCWSDFVDAELVNTLSQ